MFGKTPTPQIGSFISLIRSFPNGAHLKTTGLFRRESEMANAKSGREKLLKKNDPPEERSNAHLSQTRNS